MLSCFIFQLTDAPKMDFYQTRKPQLLKLSNILLRVPSIFILELLYNSRTREIFKEGDVLGHNPSRYISEWGLNPDNVTIGVQYVGESGCLFLLLMMLVVVVLRFYLIDIHRKDKIGSKSSFIYKIYTCGIYLCFLLKFVLILLCVYTWHCSMLLYQ